MIATPRTLANQRNAKLSTGPRTEAGKARSAKNAMRHGLSIPITRDPIERRRVEQFAKLLCGSNASWRYDQAYMLAETWIELRRIRAAQSEVLALVATAQTEADRAELARASAKIYRYQRRMLSKRRKAMADYRQDDDDLEEPF